jgi:hypothetical protein
LYDKRTLTIRLASERNIVLSNRSGKGLKQGHQAVFRRILNNNITPDQVLVMGKHNIQNKAKKCLEVKGKNADEASLQWWGCKSGKPLQKFEKEDKNKDKSGAPDFSKSRFLLKLDTKGNRNVFLSKEKLGEDFVLKLGKKPSEWRSWFIMDKRTQTIRLFVQRHLAVSNQAGKSVKPGASLVLRDYDVKDASQAVEFKGHKLLNKKSKRCFSTANNENKDNAGLNFWLCNGKDTQKWKREAVKGDYEDLCEDFVKEEKRYRKCPGKKDQYLGKHCIRQVQRKGTAEVLIKKCGKETWEIAKCHRYQQGGQWFRKCGVDHLETMKNGGPTTDN